MISILIYRFKLHLIKLAFYIKQLSIGAKYDMFHKKASTSFLCVFNKEIQYFSNFRHIFRC